MKIIDLLNKIANGEEVPKKVKYRGEVYDYIKIYKEGIRYTNLDREQNDEYRMLIFSSNALNDEVEILEEEKKIPEKLPIYDCIDVYNKFDIDDNRKAINEIIDYLESEVN